PSADAGGLREGILYVRARPDLVLVLWIAFFVGTFGLNFQLTIAAMVTGQFDLGPAAFGVASTVLAIGSLAGSLAAARRGAPRIRLVVLAALFFGAAAVVVAVMPTYLMFLVALPLVGIGALTLINSAQSFLQINAEPELRGRVMGIYTLVFLGGTPIGSPLVGWIAETFGPRWSIALGGIVSAVAALVVAIVHLRRRGLEVRAHARPRPHLHIAGAAELGEVRPGWRLPAPRETSAGASHAVALPILGVVAALSLALSGSPYTPPSPGDVDDLTSSRLMVVQDPRIDEASGMAASRLHKGVVWLLNDSKGGEVIYGVDRAGQTVAELTLDGVANRDWEAMAPAVDESGDPVLWIADIGDNDTQWTSLPVYQIPEPAELGRKDTPWRRVTLTYPDGEHNAETLLVDSAGRLFVVTKEGEEAGVYATPDASKMGSTVELERIGPAPMFLTDGAISPDGRQVALRGYTSVTLYDADEFLTEGTEGDGGTVYPLPLQRQGETLAYALDARSVLVGSEGVEQPIYEIGLPTASEPGGERDQDSVAGATDAASWIIAVTAIVLIGGTAVLLFRRRGRARQPSSPTA
ncbi:MAG: MFS transporter, partial [Actinomycetes bacterium]